MEDGNVKSRLISAKCNVRPVLVFGIVSDFEIVSKIQKFKMTDKMTDRNAKNLPISAKYSIKKFLRTL